MGLQKCFKPMDPNQAVLHHRAPECAVFFQCLAFTLLAAVVLRQTGRHEDKKEFEKRATCRYFLGNNLCTLSTGDRRKQKSHLVGRSWLTAATTAIFQENASTEGHASEVYKLLLHRSIGCVALGGTTPKGFLESSPRPRSRKLPGR